MKIVFFRTPKPRRFVHKPIYWDPEKEEREEREERVRRELGQPSKDGEYHTLIKRGSFRKGSSKNLQTGDDIQRERRNSNIRLLIIIAALLIIAAMLYLTSSEFLSL